MKHSYVSRTNCTINRVRTAALKERVKGITHVRQLVGVQHKVDIGHKVLRESKRNLIASMNFGVRQCEKELARRGVK